MKIAVSGLSKCLVNLGGMNEQKGWVDEVIATLWHREMPWRLNSSTLWKALSLL